MADQLTAFYGLEAAINDLQCVALLLSKSEMGTSGDRLPDGQVVSVFEDREHALCQTFLINELERRAVDLSREFQACFELGRGGRNV